MTLLKAQSEGSLLQHSHMQEKITSCQKII